MNSCPICDGPTREHASATIRGQYPALFLRCRNCDFIFIPNPTWLSEAYADPINQSDTGYVWRNLWARDRVSELVESFLNPDGVFLDYAAGYGLFVRLMRDMGYDFRWSDLYCQNLFARGFEAPAPLSGTFEAITAFEVFEHLTHPRVEIQKLSTHTSCLIFSTMLVPDSIPQTGDWWYYGLEHGQHVSFYTRKSLEILANEFNYRLSSDGSSLHVFSRKAFDLKALSDSNSLWQRLWGRKKKKISRGSLTVRDHDFIVEKLTEEKDKDVKRDES